VAGTTDDCGVAGQSTRIARVREEHTGIEALASVVQNIPVEAEGEAAESPATEQTPGGGAEGWIGGCDVIKAVAGEGAIAAETPRGLIIDLPIRGGQDVVQVEVDQVRTAGDAVGIVTGGAGGFLIHDVKPVAPILITAVDGMETLISQKAVTAVAFVAERVGSRAFRQ
jgi:hypothetical protein